MQGLGVVGAKLKLLERLGGPGGRCQAWSFFIPPSFESRTRPVTKVK